MGLHGFPNLTIELDDSVGGTLTDISAYVTEIGEFTVEELIEELTAAGDSTDRWGAVGFEQKDEIELKGPYDDTASGFVAITKSGRGETRTFQLTYDGATASDVLTVEVIIRLVGRAPARGQFHGYRTVLRPTGSIT